MPNIDRLLEERAKKKFTKKSYRPWDLSGAHNNQPVVANNVTESEEKEGDADKSDIFTAPQIIEPELPPKPEVQVASEVVSSAPVKKTEFTTPKKPQAIKVPVIETLTSELSQSFKQTIKQLRGNEKKLFLLVIEICSKKEALSTGELLSEDFDRMLGMTRNSRETVIKRLQKKGILKREVGKKGLNGKIILSVPNESYENALQYFANNQFDSVLNFSKNSDLVSNEFYSRKAIEEESDASLLPVEWREINIEPLSNRGFSTHHLIQLFKLDSLTPKMVQDSIDAFAFDLEKNDKGKGLTTSPVNFLMGVLRKGPYTPPDNYESPEMRLIRLYNEKQETFIKQKQEEEERLFQVEFDKWVSTLSEADKEVLLPPEIKRFKWEGPRIAALKAHFKSNLFETAKQKVMGSLDSTNEKL